MRSIKKYWKDHGGVAWGSLIALVVIQVLGIAAWWLFTWEAFVAFIVLSLVTGLGGITMGYHRLLTHESFQTYRPVRGSLALSGAIGLEGSPLEWVANHRKHHQFADKEGDPHPPGLIGFDGAHFWWMTFFVGPKEKKELFEKYAPDLLEDRWIMFLHRRYALIQGGMILLLFAIGSLLYGWSNFDWRMGLSFVGLGIFSRAASVQQMTWFVNSATHMWGYRNYPTRDESRNLWWVGLLAFGEGWHNNHHHEPRSAAHGHKWWEIDVTYRMIWLLEKIGLAWDVIRPGKAATT